jgi:hypothetical protein
MKRSTCFKQTLLNTVQYHERNQFEPGISAALSGSGMQNPSRITLIGDVPEHPSGK